MQATTCTVGAETFTEIAYYAYRPTSDDGTLVKPRKVANNVLPIGVTPQHIWWEMELGLDADEADAFYTTDYVTVPATLVSTLTVTETAKSAADGSTKTRTVTWAPAYVQTVPEMKIVELADQQVFAVRFIILGEPSFGTWT